MSAREGGQNVNKFSQLPRDTTTATSYNFKDARIAWRSSLLVAQGKVDPLAGKVLAEFSKLLFEPYGIGDPELFLAAGNSSLTTANLSPEDEKPLLLTSFIDEVKMMKSLLADLRIREDGGMRTDDGDTAAFQVPTHQGEIQWASGDAESVKAIYPLKGTRSILLDGTLADELKYQFDKSSLALTFGRDTSSTITIVNILAREGLVDTQAVSTYLTETRFTKTGMERRTVSDLGFIGWMIAQLAAE